MRPGEVFGTLVDVIRLGVVQVGARNVPRRALPVMEVSNRPERHHLMRIRRTKTKQYYVDPDDDGVAAERLGREGR